jgi:hypothetical protein
MPQKIGEIIESSASSFTAQCYELYGLPPLGSLVKTQDKPVELYAIVYHACTASLEPGRKPIARGKDEATEEAIYKSNPQLTKLLRSEFSALVVGHKAGDKLYHYLPPTPARIHSFVYACAPEEVKVFSESLNFLSILTTARLPIATDELIAAALRQMAQTHDDAQAFLVRAGKELAVLLSGQFPLVKSILGRLKP